jgi:hypothetical protein
LLSYPLWHLTNLHNNSHPLQSNLSVQSLTKMRVDISIMALEVPLKIYHPQPPSMTKTTTSRIRLNKSRYRINHQWTTTTRPQSSNPSSLNNQHRLSTKKSSTLYRQGNRYHHPQSTRHPSTLLQQQVEAMHMTSHTTQFWIQQRLLHMYLSNNHRK